jgi:hypothetical protein
MTDLNRLGPLGYRQDPPKKAGETPDRDFTLQLRPKLAEQSGDVDLRPFTTPTNQYSAGSCVGNSTADSLEVLNAIQGLPPVQLSRLFVYTMARNMMDEDLDGRGDIDRDHGTYIRLAFDVLSKFGICREDISVDQGGWPYDLEKLFVLPSLKAMRAATGHRLHSYYRITETSQDRLDAIIAALRGKHPVVFGTLVGDEFMNLTNEGPVGPPKSPKGGHAILCVGYLQNKGFIIKNSWGTGWGDNGCCIMTPEYLAWGGTTDLWVPTMGAVFG